MWTMEVAWRTTPGHPALSSLADATDLGIFLEVNLVVPAVLATSHLSFPATDLHTTDRGKAASLMFSPQSMIIQTGHVKLINLRVTCYIIGINRTLTMSYAHLKCHSQTIKSQFLCPPALACFLPTLAAPDPDLLQVWISPAITGSHVPAPTVALHGYDKDSHRKLGN